MLPNAIQGTLVEHLVLLFAGAALVAVVVGAGTAWLGAGFARRRIARDIADESRDDGAGAERRLERVRGALECALDELARLDAAHYERAALRAGGRELPASDTRPRDRA